MKSAEAQYAGFTLIELLVVMAILATLIMLTLPTYFKSIDKSKEAVLQQQLVTMRQALDHYFEDKGRYPESLEELVEERYLRHIPVDPVTESAKSWVLVPATDGEASGVYNVVSGAPGNALDGKLYREW